MFRLLDVACARGIGAERYRGTPDVTMSETCHGKLPNWGGTSLGTEKLPSEAVVADLLVVILTKGPMAAEKVTSTVRPLQWLVPRIGSGSPIIGRSRRIGPKANVSSFMLKTRPATGIHHHTFRVPDPPGIGGSSNSC